ncbi:hypothetical protein CEXT_279761 [Caerostris extrusa]|uniref:Uncharacterized protein n=1 Tax=Caerostris extrusa TaxID=172846 RepID=A0AAV4SWL5_CAEEX|nr:hypothetical protein CEXT_279761 [Caerostris extrusa]
MSVNMSAMAKLKSHAVYRRIKSIRYHPDPSSKTKVSCRRNKKLSNPADSRTAKRTQDWREISPGYVAKCAPIDPRKLKEQEEFP